MTEMPTYDEGFDAGYESGYDAGQADARVDWPDVLPEVLQRVIADWAEVGDLSRFSVAELDDLGVSRR